MTRCHRLLTLMVGCSLAVLAGCSSSGGGGGGDGGGGTAVAKGKVTDSGGTGLAAATIQSGGATTTSGADGSYSLTLTPGTALKVTASQAGRVSTFQVITLASGQTAPIDFALPTIGKRASLTSLLTTPATVTDPRGAEVRLAANTLVDSTGAAVDAATVDVTTAQPTDASFASSFPGLFIGTKAGADAPLQSFGYVTVTITSGSGKPCNLKSGATADLAIPVSTGADPGTPTIDLWSLDEVTGKWTFVVAATRDTSGTPVVYRAQVSHFSVYNLDRPIDTSLPFKVTVKEPGGATISGASVVIRSTDQTNASQWVGRGVTDASGLATFPLVPAGSVQIDATAAQHSDGQGYHYDVVNGTATMTITLYRMVTRTYTLVYLVNGVQTSVGKDASVDADWFDPVGATDASGFTDANSRVTLTLEDGRTQYTYRAVATVGPQRNTQVQLNATVTSLAGIPAVWVLTPQH